MTTAIVFHRFGPYHAVRLRAAIPNVDVHAVELSRRTDVYAWNAIELGEHIPYSCVSESIDSRSLKADQLYRLVEKTMDDIAPTSVAVNGWSDNGALASLAWCLKRKVPAILMSDSNRFDERRTRFTEWLKRQVVSCYSSAIVAGTSASEYVIDLGIPAGNIFVGYDVIDNDHFDPTKNSEVTRLPRSHRYFLASNRFVEKKNLPRLLKAYATYREKCKRDNSVTRELWDLVLLGDGPMRNELVSLAEQLQLSECVRFVGFKQYDELPAFYWNADAFIHVSTTEQWGLVINEAMASGLPVIVSNRCGSVSDLVKEGVNGFAIDPSDVEQIAMTMFKVASHDFPRAEYGNASRNIIREWGPARFANGLKGAAEMALQVGPRRPRLASRLVLELLRRR